MWKNTRKPAHHRTTAEAVKNLSQAPRHEFKDVSQRWWQLTNIQVGGGLANWPGLVAGIHVYHYYGFANAILALLIGNLIFWIISLALCTMRDKKRLNILEISHEFFGSWGKYILSILLVAATVSWFSVQLDETSSFVLQLFKFDKTPLVLFIQIGVILGILSTFISIYDIRGIKWFTTFSLPVILIFVAVLLVTNGRMPLNQQVANSLSLIGVPIVLKTFLAGTADLPTFFRHSRSRANTVIGLSSIFTLNFALQISIIFLWAIFSAPTNQNPTWHLSTNATYVVLLVTFIYVLGNLGANASNIYAGSIGWEVLAPRLIGKKEYVILGLVATTIFTILPFKDFMESTIKVVDVFLAPMALILIASFVTSRFHKFRNPRSLHLISLIPWLVGSLSGILALFCSFEEINPLWISICLSLAMFIILLIGREIVWGIKRL